MATDKLVEIDHVTDYISREAAYKTLTEYYHHSSGVQHTVLREALNRVPTADVRPVPPGGIGEMSDGYHTFNGLYYQRMVLFAALVKQNKDSAWKSHRHEDGKPCFDGGWFIVGIDTPKGNYTYHYEDKDWDLFDCEELPVGKHWDGHTEDDVTRLLSLPEMRPVVRGKWKFEIGDGKTCVDGWVCTNCNCGFHTNVPYFEEFNFCPNCGAEMSDSQTLEDAAQDADAGSMAPAT